MTEPTAEEIAARLTPEQRDGVSGVPQSWSEADAFPDGLFDYDETYDRETGEETRFWRVTELGEKVRAIVEAEDS